MPMLNGRVLLFDYDDTLAKTEGIALGAACVLLNRILSERNAAGYELPAFVEQFTGTTFRRILTAASEDRKIVMAAEELDHWVEVEKQGAIAALAQQLEATDGVNQFLARLTELGNLMAIASSSAPDRLEVCLDKTGQKSFFGDRVFSVQCPTFNGRGKPAPDVYLHAMDTLGVQPEICEVFEDSVGGVKSAVAAGCRTWGYVGALPQEKRMARAEALVETGACCVFDNWAQFDSLFEQVERGGQKDVNCCG